VDGKESLRQALNDGTFALLGLNPA
jgi:hypothetical protein